MKAPINSKRLQQVFLVNNIDQKGLKILFKAFQLNRQMLTEMDLKQNITKIVPYMHSKYNNFLMERRDYSSDASDVNEN